VKRTLYVYRRLLNATALANWAYEAGFQNILSPKDMHVTVCYSKTPLQWPDEKWSESLTVVPFGRQIDFFDSSAAVLRIKSPSLTERHKMFIGMGASHDYPDYNPHITIAYGDQDKGLKDHVYNGHLHFGGEVFKEIDPNKFSQALEKK
jgi:hypothetical protein